MAKIYKLVAERRDRNQSMRRKRKDRNINLFKESIDSEVEYRRPTLYRNVTMRQRTVSDQQPGRDLQLPPFSGASSRRPSYDLLMANIKNQVKEVDTKVDSLTRKIDELSNSILVMKLELNKK
jgi:hypothetical protein